MNKSTLRGALTLMAIRSVAALTAWLLLVPFFGPLLDHHFAERQPDHQHLYVGAVAPDHTHPYEVPHDHSHGHQTPDALAESLPDGIVYLSSYEGMSTSLANLTVPDMHLGFVLPDPEDDLVPLGAAGDDVFYQEAFIAPPDKPPRA